MTALTVVIATDGRLPTLRRALDSLEAQTHPRDAYEVLVVDDESTDETERWCASWQDGGLRRYVRQHRSGTPLARNLGLFMARSPLVLFLDDDQIADAELLDEHLRAHQTFPEPVTAVVGNSTWRHDSPPTPVMHYLSMVDSLPFSYPSTPRELAPSVAHFRSRQLSVKRPFLVQRGVHAAAFGLLADVELGCRLARYGLMVRYWSHARSDRVTTFTFDEWCELLRREGRAIAQLAATHDCPDVRSRSRVDAEVEQWRRDAPRYDEWRETTRRLEIELGPTYADHPDESRRPLWRLYGRCFASSRRAGIADGVRAASWRAPHSSG